MLKRLKAEYAYISFGANTHMAEARMDILSKEEEDLIHLRSLDILNDIGVLIRSECVLKLLEEQGSDVDYRKQIAHISEEMVHEALESAPNSFVLRARNRKNDIELPTPGLPYLTTDGLTLYVRDIETGERRDATRNDFAQFARLADALDAISFFWPIVTISDVPEAVHNLHELWESFKNCELHVQGDSVSAEDARRQIEIASLVTGGLDELKKGPIFSCAIDPVAPLSFEKGAVEAQVEFAKAGIPVLSHSMCLMGMSSPVTIAGTLTIINAENLASLVITQSTARGAPHIYGSSSTPIDMLTGNINYSAPEGLLISAGIGHMARRYERPCMISDWGAGTKGQGIPTSFSELFAHMATVFSGSDLIPGIGGLEDAKGCSLAQMIVDSAIWDNFQAFLRTFSVDESSFALDVVKDVGHGNSFLTHQHTAKNFRKELYFWNREWLDMEATLSDCMIPNASEIVRNTLKEHEVNQLDNSVIYEGEALLRNFA